MKEKKIFFKVLFITILSLYTSILNISQVFALDGNIDTTFTSGTGPNNVVYTTIFQPDGKILIGGYFTSYNGTPRNRIARLNSDGTLDTSFDPGAGAVGGGVLALSLQSDGKILVGGEFTTYNGSSRSKIARLNSDGTLDTSFDPGTGADNHVYTILLQSDGKIIVGGGFANYNGTPRNRIARLNTDGTLDTSFDPGTAANQVIYTSSLQSDGKILVGGFFTSYNGTPRNRIARLNSDGTLDTSFNPGSGAGMFVFSVSLQSDGKVLLGGFFTSYNGTPRNRIARLNTDGTLDTSFDPGAGANDTIYSSTIQSDGKILIGGYFTSYNGTPRNRIARLNSDGTLDTSFNPNTGAGDGGISTFTIQPDGKILIGGEFATYNGSSAYRYITRLRLNAGPTDLSLSNNIVNENNSSPLTIGNISTIDIDTEDTHIYTLSCATSGLDDASFTINANQLDIIVPTDFEVKSAYNVCIRTTDLNGLSFDKLITITVNDILESTPAPIISSGGGNININNSILQPTPQVIDVVHPTVVTSPLDGGTLVCNPFKSYLKFNSYKNIVSEVTLWQAYLNKFHNENLSLTGFYDTPTFEAMKRFQSKYKTEVLDPWNLKNATGYTYKTTRAKANQLLGCPEGTILLENGKMVDIK